MPSTVKVITFDLANRVVWGPTFSDRATTGSGLSQLGCGFMEFAESATTDVWTLPYEEVLLVLAGTLRLEVVEGDSTSQVIVQEGQIVTLAKGSTVTYSGESGTRMYWSLVPHDWHVSAS
jgi:ethanolamine utilization protein EutQ (cupin superfamily)